jgi:hypothetical protein
MTDHHTVKHRFLDFMFKQIDELREQGMPEKEAAELVMDTVFLTLHNTWVDAYGARKMAEEFYQIADGLVAKSMEKYK